MFSNHTRSQRDRPYDRIYASLQYFAKLSAITLVTGFLSACQSSPSPKEFSGVMMHVPYKILIGNPISSSQEEKIHKIINETFHHIDQIYNNWNPSSEISLLSSLPAYQKVPLSPGLENFLRKVDRLYLQSGGLFDVTIEPLSTLWKKGKPDPLILSETISKIGWEKVHIEDHFFWKECADISFDLGGIAKGYAVDLLAENLALEGCSHVLVDWGGEICAKGHHPSGRSWQVGIKNTNTVVALNDKAVATSGGEYQFWTIEGIEYMHIINPKTHMPLQKKTSSITVMAPSCLLADALATILMIFDDPLEGKKWLSLHYPEASII